MMGWLLLILKIVGILIATVLLAILLILFVPFCYRAKIRYGPKPLCVSAGVSWLLFVLRINVSYLEQKLLVMVRVFGILVYRSDKEKKEPRKKAREKAEKKRKKAKQQKPQEAKTAKRQELPDAETAAGPQKLQEAGEGLETGQKEDAFAQKASGKEDGAQPQAEQKIAFFGRIADKMRKLWETICKAVKKFGQLLRQADAVRELLSKEESKRAISFAWDKLKRLLLHMLPRRVSGRLVYGSGDPCSTGQALGVLAVLYARYGEMLSIQPDFEEKRLECDIALKGRVQLFTLLLLAVKVIINQEVRQLLREFKDIKTIE